MHLAIDTVGARHSGSSIVAREVVREAARHPGVSRVTVYCSPASERNFDFEVGNRINVVENPRASRSSVARVAWQLRDFAAAAAREQADVILGLSNGVVGNGQSRSCVFLQQGLPFAPDALAVLPLPQRARQAVIRETMWASARLADLVVVQTEWMRDAAIAHLGAPPEKVRVHAPVPADLLSATSHADPGVLAHMPGLKVLYVGNDLPYKNIQVVSEAVARARRAGHEVSFASTAKVDASRGVLLLPTLDRAQLRRAYAEADVLVMPSLVESFGLPLWEAMHMGLPVIAADRPYARNVCGDAAFYFDPKAPETLASLLAQVASDAALRRSRVEKGVARAAAYHDDASRLLDACCELAAQGSGGRKARLRSARAKRAIDVAVSASLLTATAPLMVGAAIAIRAQLGSPVLFRQERPGQHGRAFELVKFRTMRHSVPGADQSDAARLTRLGRILRATSVDELPTLWNVLRGDMSLVGPRPLLMRYLTRYSPGQARRHDVKPGITGWAQVNGRNSLTWRRKFLLDVWYVDHWSVAVDLWILALTAWHVIAPKGIAAAGHATMPEFTGNEDA